VHARKEERRKILRRDRKEAYEIYIVYWNQICCVIVSEIVAKASSQASGEASRETLP